MSLPTSYYEYIIQGLAVVVGYFLVRLVNSVDAMRKDVSTIKESMPNYVTRDELRDSIVEVKEDIDKEMRICRAINHSEKIQGIM